MAIKKSVEVIIGKQRLSLRTDADPEQVKRAADLVNGKIKDVTPSGQLLNQQHLILIAMQLADELLRQSEANQQFREQVKTKSKSILTRLDQDFSL